MSIIYCTRLFQGPRAGLVRLRTPSTKTNLKDLQKPANAVSWAGNRCVVSQNPRCLGV